jgi:glycine cleavage system aminomethyltransferase T
MHQSLTPAGAAMTASPLDAVLRQSGAAMVARHGRMVAAHFESTSAEVAACLSTVGLADRSDRATLEVRGAPAGVDRALMALAWVDDRAWWSRADEHRAIVRCEPADVAVCSSALGGATDVAVSDRGFAYAAVGVIGPHAGELLRTASVGGPGVDVIVLREAEGSFEALVAAQHGPLVWKQLLEAGGPLHAACVGSDALEQLAASHRFDHRHGTARIH